MPTDLMTTAEAAKALGVSVATVTRMALGDPPELVAAFQAPGIRGARFFRRRDVERLATRRAKASAA